MDGGSVTTPFGRRPMTLGMLASQVRAQKIESSASVDKWKIYRALCEAKPLLDISDRALAVLNALLSFYPHGELSAERSLVVFPSNNQLSIRCHGMAEQTVRRHMASLIASGLVLRKDSPNGKRYARKDRQGEIRDAYGFSLAPLLARADEIERLAAKVAAEKLHLQTIKEQLTLCRRDISKLITAAIAESADGDWRAIDDAFHSILNKLPRVATPHLIASVLAELEEFRAEIVKQLETQIKTENPSANALQNERHIQISESESISESEHPVANAGDGLTAVNSADLGDNALERQKLLPGKASITYPITTVTETCPDIALYGPGGSVRTWSDLISASTIVSTMLQIDPSAYHQAVNRMGVQNTAVAIACIFQKGSTIASPGGYLRTLSRRAGEGRFNTWPMLAALRRANISEPAAGPPTPVTQ